MENKNPFILLVDDDEDDCFLLGQTLKALEPKYEIRYVMDGNEALKKLEEMKVASELPCLVVMDINMPKMDGKRALVAFQEDEHLSKVPVVIMSTSYSPVDQLFFKRKNVELITKPFGAQELCDFAKKLLSYCTA